MIHIGDRLGQAVDPAITMPGLLVLGLFLCCSYYGTQCKGPTTVLQMLTSNLRLLITPGKLYQYAFQRTRLEYHDDVIVAWKPKRVGPLPDAQHPASWKPRSLPPPHVKRQPEVVALPRKLPAPEEADQERSLPRKRETGGAPLAGARRLPPRRALAPALSAASHEWRESAFASRRISEPTRPAVTSAAPQELRSSVTAKGLHFARFPIAAPDRVEPQKDSVSSVSNGESFASVPHSERVGPRRTPSSDEPRLASPARTDVSGLSSRVSSSGRSRVSSSGSVRSRGTGCSSAESSVSHDAAWRVSRRRLSQRRPHPQEPPNQPAAASQAVRFLANVLEVDSSEFSTGESSDASLPWQVDTRQGAVPGSAAPSPNDRALGDRMRAAEESDSSDGTSHAGASSRTVTESHADESVTSFRQRSHGVPHTEESDSSDDASRTWSGSRVMSAQQSWISSASHADGVGSSDDDDDDDSMDGSRTGSESRADENYCSDDPSQIESESCVSRSDALPPLSRRANGSSPSDASFWSSATSGRVAVPLDRAARQERDGEDPSSDESSSHSQHHARQPFRSASSRSSSEVQQSPGSQT